MPSALPSARPPATITMSPAAPAAPAGVHVAHVPLEDDSEWSRPDVMKTPPVPIRPTPLRRLGMRVDRSRRVGSPLDVVAVASCLLLTVLLCTLVYRSVRRLGAWGEGRGVRGVGNEVGGKWRMECCVG